MFPLSSSAGLSGKLGGPDPVKGGETIAALFLCNIRNSLYPPVAASFMSSNEQEEGEQIIMSFFPLPSTALRVILEWRLGTKTGR